MAASRKTDLMAFFAYIFKQKKYEHNIRLRKRIFFICVYFKTIEYTQCVYLIFIRYTKYDTVYEVRYTKYIIRSTIYEVQYTKYDIRSTIYAALHIFCIKLNSINHKCYITHFMR